MYLTIADTELFWDATYAIVLVLLEEYPQTNPVNVGLEELYGTVIALPNFKDDPNMVTERILLDIQTVWYEEATTL